MSSFCPTLYRPRCYPLETVEMNCTDSKDSRLLYNPSQASFFISQVSRAKCPQAEGLGLPVQ